LPRPRFPKFIAKGLLEEFSNIVLCGNPTRLVIGSREIVVFRDDLYQKLDRCRAVKTASTQESVGDLRSSEDLVKTVMDQSHLCPLPLNIQPTFWNRDHGLRLYPLPNLLVLCDFSFGTGSSWDWTYMGSQCVNPGSFSSPEDESSFEGSYMIYDPVEDQATVHSLSSLSSQDKEVAS